MKLLILSFFFIYFVFETTQVECCIKPFSNVKRRKIIHHVQVLLEKTYPNLILNSKLPSHMFINDSILHDHLEELAICELTNNNSNNVNDHKNSSSQFASHQNDTNQNRQNSFNFDMNPVAVSIHKVKLNIYVYKLNEIDVEQEFNQEEGISTFNILSLPNYQLKGVWDTLIFDENIPLKLLNFMYTSMLFGERDVDPNLISWNKVILLHGPPGTGKTTLCKALSQKLAIRLNASYKTAKLVEINTHSLFSRFFSESGKLVMKMFQSLNELVDDEESFVCVLIDEVESLTAARKAAATGNEPSDAIRVVNALLTQLDQLKTRHNVLVMTTSNLTNVIDDAFMDRADIRQYIGPPSPVAMYAILVTCIEELMKVGLITPQYKFVDWRAIQFDLSENTQGNHSQKLYEIVKKTKVI